MLDGAAHGDARDRTSRGRARYLMTFLNKLEDRLGGIIEGSPPERRLDLAAIESKVHRVAFENTADSPIGTRELPRQIVVRISLLNYKQNREYLSTHANRMRQRIVIAAAEQGVVEPEPVGLQITYEAAQNFVVGDHQVLVRRTSEGWSGQPIVGRILTQTGAMDTSRPRERAFADWRARAQRGLLQVASFTAAFLARAILAAGLSGALGAVGGVVWASIDTPGPLWVEALYLTHTGRVAPPDISHGELIAPEIIAWWVQCHNDAGCIETGIREAPESKARDLRQHYRIALGREACDNEIKNWMVGVDRFGLSRHDLIEKVRLSEEAKEFARTGHPRAVVCPRERR